MDAILETEIEVVKKGDDNGNGNKGGVNGNGNGYNNGGSKNYYRVL